MEFSLVPVNLYATPRHALPLPRAAVPPPPHFEEVVSEMVQSGELSALSKLCADGDSLLRPFWWG